MYVHTYFTYCVDIIHFVYCITTNKLRDHMGGCVLTHDHTSGCVNTHGRIMGGCVHTHGVITWVGVSNNRLAESV